MKRSSIYKSWRQYVQSRYAARIFKYISLWLCGLFVTVFLMGSLQSVIAQTELPEVNTPKSFQEIRGVWMTANDNDIFIDRHKLENAVSELARLNFNTIYPVVWNSGYVWYPSTVAQQAGIQDFVRRGLQGHNILAEVTSQAHQRNLMVIPWFEFGFMTPESSELAINHPDWLTQRRDGSKTQAGDAGEVAWLNPFHPKVQKFITDLALEVVTQYDVDGIQFDDHFSLPNEFGYDRYTVALYKQETNLDPPANPQDPTWVRWRANKITQFVTQLNQAVKERKPRAIFSISPNPYKYAYNAQLQDWLTWVRQGIVDELIVQVYRPDLPSFVEHINAPELQEVQQKIPTGVGILTGLRNKPVSMQLIQNKVLAARSRGLGLCFFFYESLWNNAPEPLAQRQSTFKSLFDFPVLRSAITPVRNNLPSFPPVTIPVRNNLPSLRPVTIPVRNNLPSLRPVITPTTNNLPSLPSKITPATDNLAPLPPVPDPSPPEDNSPY
jgi:uncharacterized lipoprotein YddW (UPF0748 family)